MISPGLNGLFAMLSVRTSRNPLPRPDDSAGNPSRARRTGTILSTSVSSKTCQTAGPAERERPIGRTEERQAVTESVGIRRPRLYTYDIRTKSQLQKINN